MKIGMLVATLIFLAPPAVANACSVVEGYKVPTSLELAERADTIVLGSVESQVDGESEFDYQVVIKPMVLIKGSSLPEMVRIRGFIPKPADRMRVTRSDPNQLWEPNPDSLMGGCNRYTFEKGMILVLFFEKENGELRFAGYPFARVSEDVPSIDALWVRAVRMYVEIASLPKKAQRAALKAKQAEFAARAGDDDAQALAEDIGRHLSRRRIAPYD